MGRGENLQIREKNFLRAGFFLEGGFFLGAARFSMARRLGLQNTDSTTPALTMVNYYVFIFLNNYVFI